MGASVPGAPAEEERVQNLRRIGGFLTLLWILHCAAGVYDLPLRVFLKTHLGLAALGVSSTLFLGGLAWSLKPIFAWVCDSFPIRRRRRVPYILLGSSVAILGFLGLLLLPRTESFIAGSLAVSQIGMVFCSCSLGGLMVETGNRAENLAKLSSIRGTIWNGMALVSGPLAGFLAGLWIGWAYGLCIACCALTISLMFVMKEPHAAALTTNPIALIIGPFKGLFLHRNFWYAIIATVLLYIAPGFGTPLLFFQLNVLKFSTQTIGNFGLVSGTCAIFSGLACVALSKRWSLGRLIVVATLVNAAGTLAYLQYNSLGHAAVIEGVNGFISAPSQIVAFLLAGYAIPRGYEAIGYSIIMALGNFVGRLSDVTGSYLSDHLHWTFHQLVWINAGTTLAIILIVPFIPRAMLGRKDVAGPRKGH